MTKIRYLVALILISLLTLPSLAYAAPTEVVRDSSVTVEQQSVVDNFFKVVETSILQAPIRRMELAQSQAPAPVELVAQFMDSPDADLYPTSVMRKKNTVQALSADIIRSCALWITTYNKGPASEANMCWDLTLRNGTIVKANPYGTDEILASTSAPETSLPPLTNEIPATTTPDSTFCGSSHRDPYYIAGR